MVLLNFMIMRKFSFALLLLFVASLCVTSCKSVGYHVEGISHIFRHDTITSKVISDKPITTDKIVDFE